MIRVMRQRSLDEMLARARRDGRWGVYDDAEYFKDNMQELDDALPFHPVSRRALTIGQIKGIVMRRDRLDR